MKRGCVFGFLASLCMTSALTTASAPAQSAGCFVPPYSCLPKGDINPSTPATYASQYQAYAELVWQDFLALNFPASTDGSGNPLPQPSTTNGLNHNGGDYTSVWQVWSQATDIFLPGAAQPAAFGTGHETPPICIARGGGPRKVLKRSARGRALGNLMVLDEYVQANRMGPVIDKNGKYVRYGLNFNRDMYNYIVNNDLYSTEGQLRHDIRNPNRDLDTVRFPPGTYENGTSVNPGSIFVKSSWKILGPGDDPLRFHRIQAYIYDEKGGAFHDEPTVTERCSLETVGLVGLHIVHLTNSAPQWIWATFEHVSNAPWFADFATSSPAGPFSFFNLATCPSAPGRPGCTYNTLPAQPWNPQTAGQTPLQLVRVAAPGERAVAANQSYIAQLQQAYGSTVWQNYFLVDVQFPTIVKALNDGTGKADVNPAYPAGAPSPGFLANSTMETFIQGFSAGDRTTNGNAIPVTDQMQNIVVTGPPVNPIALSIYNKSGGAERLTSSCVGCHADATMTTGSSSHLVFSLSRAQPRAVGQPTRGGTSDLKAPLDREAVRKAHQYLAPPQAKSSQ